MKSLLAGAAALATALFLLPATASANHGYRTIGKCGSCGGSIYSQFVRVGYNSCGQPIYRSVRMPHQCRSRSHRSSSYYSRSPYSYGNYGYGYSRGSSCSPYRRSGFSITIRR